MVIQNFVLVKNKKKIPPIFITLEGNEGCGKSTQAEMLKMLLLSKKMDVILTREPGGILQAEKIRNLLISNKNNYWDNISEYLLLSAARREHLSKIIWPALVNGRSVICDRFYGSSFSYQGYGSGISLGFLRYVYQCISYGFVPHLTFVLLINLSDGFHRVNKRNLSFKMDYYESMNLNFHKRLVNAYKNLIKKNPNRFVLIDGSQSVSKIFFLIKKNLEIRGII